MPNIFLKIFLQVADLIDILGEKRMLTLLFSLCMVGYGAAYEGNDNGKYYFGVYTPTHEYGWVVTDSEIYLDTVLEKRR